MKVARNLLKHLCNNVLSYKNAIIMYLEQTYNYSSCNNHVIITNESCKELMNISKCYYFVAMFHLETISNIVILKNF